MTLRQHRPDQRIRLPHVRLGLSEDRRGEIELRVVVAQTHTSKLQFFALFGTGVLSKTESDDGNEFTRALCNSMSCEKEPTRIL